MGDYAGSYDRKGDEEVKYVVSTDLEDWSWMHTTHTADAEALNEGEYYNEEDGINYTCDSSQQVGTASGYGHRRVRSASAAIEEVEESGSSENEEEVNPKTKNLGQFQHLREPPLDAHSDPGYGAGSYNSTEHPEVAISHSINRVTSWFQKSSFREYDSETTNLGQFQHLREPPLDAHSDPGYGARSYNNTEDPEVATSHSVNRVTSWLQNTSVSEHDSETTTTATTPSPPKRRPPPRCLPRRYNPPAADMATHHQMDQRDHEAPYYEKTPTWNPSGDQCGYSEDHQLAIQCSDSSANWGVYRPEPKALDKALKFVRIGAVGFANASKTAAVGLKSRSRELKNLAVPVLTPILNAVIEESKEQLMPTDKGRGRATPTLEGGRGRGQGRGRVPAPGGPVRPPMRSVMRPGMGPRPLTRPGMGPPGSQPMAPRPNMMPRPPISGAPPIARGRGVPMRGRAMPVPTKTPIDF